MIRILAIAMALAAAGRADETWTVTLTVKAMHCDECEKRLDAQLRSIPGVKEVTRGDVTVTVSIAEKSDVRRKTLQAAVPGDMKLQKIEIAIRGTAAAAGGGVALTAKDSGARYDLADGGAKVDDLKKAMGGRNRFKISGELTLKDGKETIALEKFEAVDWKE